MHIKTDIKEINDCIVLYFGTDRKQINAYTLASSLVAFADAAKAANLHINPGYDVEIIVEALEDGSIKAILRAVFRPIENLWSNQNVRSVVLSVIAAAIYDLVTTEQPQIVIEGDVVIVNSNYVQIEMTKETYEEKEKIKSDPQFSKSIKSIIKAVKNDTKIISFGVEQEKQEDNNNAVPIIHFPDEAIILENEDDKNRDIYEETEVEILKAILERGKRKWEFVWRGDKISGPVLDEAFYDSFFNHQITIAPGDALSVQLHIIQEKHPDIDVYINKKFEVTKVRKHISKFTQDKMQL